MSYWNLNLIGMASVQNPCTDFCHINQMPEDPLIPTVCFTWDMLLLYCITIAGHGISLCNLSFLHQHDILLIGLMPQKLETSYTTLLLTHLTMIIPLLLFIP